MDLLPWRVQGSLIRPLDDVQVEAPRHLVAWDCNCKIPWLPPSKPHVLTMSAVSCSSPQPTLLTSFPSCHRRLHMHHETEYALCGAKEPLSTAPGRRRSHLLPFQHSDSPPYVLLNLRHHITLHPTLKSRRCRRDGALPGPGYSSECRDAGV